MSEVLLSAIETSVFLNLLEESYTLTATATPTPY
jgi:hypothetical protein